jgi:hypothetical protein
LNNLADRLHWRRGDGVVNNFDVLKAMGERGLKVTLAPLSNILNMRKVKAGTQVTIGLEGDLIMPLLEGKFVGGLILADQAEFYRVKADLEARTDG